MNPILRDDVVITPQGEIVCRAGFKLLNWGYVRKRKRYKFRSPLIKKNGICLFKDTCWKTKYGPVFYISEDNPITHRIMVIRNSPMFKKIYRKRTIIERFFCIVRLSKEYYGKRFLIESLFGTIKQKIWESFQGYEYGNGRENSEWSNDIVQHSYINKNFTFMFKAEIFTFCIYMPLLSPNI